MKEVYKLRNGIIVVIDADRENLGWVEVVYVPDDCDNPTYWAVGQEHCLYMGGKSDISNGFNNMFNRLNWEGSDYGEQYDVAQKLAEVS